MMAAGFSFLSVRVDLKLVVCVGNSNNNVVTSRKVGMKVIYYVHDQLTVE